MNASVYVYDFCTKKASRYWPGPGPGHRIRKAGIGLAQWIHVEQQPMGGNMEMDMNLKTRTELK